MLFFAAEKRVTDPSGVFLSRISCISSLLYLPVSCIRWFVRCERLLHFTLSLELLRAGGAAATGVALYYLLRDDGSGRKEKESEVRKLSRNDVRRITTPECVCATDSLYCLLSIPIFVGGCSSSTCASRAFALVNFAFSISWRSSVFCCSRVRQQRSRC